MNFLQKSSIKSSAARLAPRTTGADLSSLSIALVTTVGVLVSSNLLSGCSLAPDVPKSTVTAPAQYKEAADLSATAAREQWKVASPAEGTDRGHWWLIFADPQLNDLEAQALAANPDLASAAANVNAAHAVLRGAKADRSPQLGLSSGFTRQKSTAATLGLPSGTQVAPYDIWQAGLSASYEVDLFGRVANSVAAAKADAAAVEASYRSVLLALQADVAQQYFQLRTLDAEVALLEQTTALRKQNVNLTEKRFAAGDVSELDVARARTELATTQADTIALHGQRAVAEHALALLLGQVPSSYQFAAQPLATDVAIPFVPADLPSSLLERRPDVAAAQARINAAVARVGLARAARFPALALTADGGYASYQLSDLFTWDVRTWAVNAVLSLPIIDGGRNQATIDKAKAGLTGSVEDYRSSVLAAFGDVEDKLALLSSVRGQSQTLDQAVVAARRASELADKRYRTGEDSYLTLIDTQRSQLSIERQAVELRGGLANSTIALIRSLGGDWTATTTAQSSAPAVVAQAN